MLKTTLAAAAIITATLTAGHNAGEVIADETANLRIALQAASTYDWTPCRSEDQETRCIWDARHMGNGEGRSYKVRRDGSIRYLTHRRAHYLLHR